MPPNPAPTPMSIPNPGDINAQAAQAQQMSSQIAAAAGGSVPTTALLSAGVTLLSASGNKEIQQVATDLFGGASAGFAVGGPYGAIVGAAAGTVQAILSIGTYEGAQTYIFTQGEQAIYKRLGEWLDTSVGQGISSGLPQGWYGSDYAGATIEAAGWGATKRPNFLWHLLQETEKDLAKGPGIQGDASLPDTENLYLGSVLAPSGGVLEGTMGQIESGDPQGKATAMAGPPLCTPVFWYFANPSAIQDCILNEWFGYAVPPYAGGSSGSAPPLRGTPSAPGVLDNWERDVVPPPAWVKRWGPVGAQKEVVKRARGVLPDPLYFNSALYAQQLGPKTYYYNCGGLIALASILGMRSVGASTRAVVSELLLQRQTLVGGGGCVCPVFQALLDDHLALAQHEQKHGPWSGMGDWSGLGAKSVSGRNHHHAPPTSAPSIATPKRESRTAAAKVITSFIARYLHR